MWRRKPVEDEEFGLVGGAGAFYAEVGDDAEGFGGAGRLWRVACAGTRLGLGPAQSA